MYTSIEPLLPSEEKQYNVIEDLSIELISKSSAFNSQLNVELTKSIGDLIRSMNCYYSNLIEGHHTTLYDIDRALNSDYSTEPEKRDLQLEAHAHILVQRKIDMGEYDDIETLSAVAIMIHRDFYAELPESLHKISNKNRDREITFRGGEVRNGDVSVGRHIPPKYTDIHSALKHFDSRYNSSLLTTKQKIYSIPASHHRFCWIHPFFDGNGRVSRLLSHYMLRQYSVGNSLWSVSRGLARTVEEYKSKLQNADKSRQGDLDGRGALSEQALVDFIEYFLKTCIDQIDFMKSLLTPANLLRNIEIYTNREIENGNLLKGSFNVLREAFYNDTVSRGKAPELTGYKERQAREVLKKLQENKLIISKTKEGQGDFSLNIPVEVVEDWFPKLFS